MKNLSLHILDIVQNSIRAGAGTVKVELSDEYDGMMTLRISDDGKGMDNYQLEHVKDPFFSTRKTRKIGLGVSLLTQKAEQAGGQLSIQSAPGEGTTVNARFLTNHPDCPPLGKIPECAWMLMASNPEMRMVFRFTSAMGESEWDSHLIREELGGLLLTEGLIRISILEWFNADFLKFKHKRHDQG